MSLSFLLLLLSITLSALFSGLEMAFLSANRLKIEIEQQQGKWLSGIISRFIQKPAPLIATFLIGNNLALVLYGISFSQLIDTPLHSIVRDEYLHLTLKTILSTLIVLITAEFLPKILFGINPNSVLKNFFLLILFFYILFYPIVMFIHALLFFLFKITGRSKTTGKLIFSKIDLGQLIENVNEETEKEMNNELEILKNAIEFPSLKVRDCMIPRTEICAVDITDRSDTLLQKFIETGYSKIIIYKDNIDNILGYVHSFEMYKKPAHIQEVLRPLFFIPETMTAQEALRKLIKERKSVAIVLDEFGGTAGLITMEDIVEQIFGEIEDEHDEPEFIEKRLGPQEYLFSGRLEVEYLNKKYHLSLPENENYSTLAGLVMYHLESIPQNNDRLILGPYTLTIKQVSGKKVELILLKIHST